MSPGSFATEALKGWAQSVGIDGNDLYAVMRGIDEHFGHPAFLPRAGDPAEIGPVIAFVASRRNSYMTGADINVDGGSDFTYSRRTPGPRRETRRCIGNDRCN